MRPTCQSIGEAAHIVGMVLVMFSVTVMANGPVWHPHMVTSQDNELYAELAYDSGGNMYLSYWIQNGDKLLIKYSSSLTEVWRCTISHATFYGWPWKVLVDENDGTVFWIIGNEIIGNPGSQLRTYFVDINTGGFKTKSVGQFASSATTSWWRPDSCICGTDLYVVAQSWGGGRVERFSTATGALLDTYFVQDNLEYTGGACSHKIANCAATYHSKHYNGGWGGSTPRTGKLVHDGNGAYSWAWERIYPAQMYSYIPVVQLHPAFVDANGDDMILVVNQYSSNSPYRAKVCAVKESDGADIWCSANIAPSNNIDLGRGPRTAWVTFEPSSGNPIFVATHRGDIDGSGPAVYLGHDDAVIFMYSRVDGNLLITRQLGTEHQDVPGEIIVLDGSVYMAFYTKWQAATTPQSYLSQPLSNPNTQDVILTYVDMGSCDPGQYASGSPPCSPCPSGQYTDQANQLSCKTCPAGSSSAAGSSSCTECTAGYYAPTVGSSACFACPPGEFSDSVAATQCKLCLQGLYSANNASTSCDRCEVGAYQPNQGSGSCITCPGGSTTEAQGSSTATSCDCGTGLYGDPFGRSSSGAQPTACRGCPGNTKCARGTRIPLTEAGYWLDSSDPESVYSCWPKVACPADSNDCADGYEGTSCDRCANGYYRLNQICKACDYNSIPTWVVGLVLGGAGVAAVLVAILVLLGTIVFLKCSRTLKKLFRPLVVAKIVWSSIGTKLIRFAQLITIVVNLPVSWPASFNLTMSIGSILSLNVDNFIQVECILGTSTTGVERKMQIYLLRLLLPYVVLLLGTLVLAGLCICSFLTRNRRNELEAREKQPIRRRCAVCDKLVSAVDSTQRVGWMAFVFALELLYVAIHTQVMLTFSCYEKVSGRYYMVMEPSVQCFTGEGSYWISAAAIAAVSFFTFSLGLPIFFLVFLCITSPKHTNRMTERAGRLGLGAFYASIVNVSRSVRSPYEDAYFWWPVVQIMNRFFMAMAFPLTALSTTDSLMAMFWTGLLFLILHVSFWPFRRILDDWLELSMRVSMVAIVESGILFMTTANETDGVTNVGSIILQVITLAVLGQCLFAFLVYSGSLVAYELGLGRKNRVCRWLLYRTAEKHVDVRRGPSYEETEKIPMSCTPTQAMNPFDVTVNVNVNSQDVSMEKHSLPPQDDNTGAIGQVVQAQSVPVSESASQSPAVIHAEAKTQVKARAKPTAGPPNLNRSVHRQRHHDVAPGSGLRTKFPTGRN